MNMNMNTDTNLDLRPHPLDPARIGSQGLVALLVGKFEQGMNDMALVTSYASMTEALLDVRHCEVVRG